MNLHDARAFSGVLIAHGILVEISPSESCKPSQEVLKISRAWQDWQGPALEALASWLHEDMNRIEGRLSQQQSIARFVQLFNTYSTRGGSNALARLLDPFLKILKKSPQITVSYRLFSRGQTLCLPPFCFATQRDSKLSAGFWCCLSPSAACC